MELWLAVDKKGNEMMFDLQPIRLENYWAKCDYEWAEEFCLPKGFIKKLLGKELIWEDGAFEVTEEMLNA